MKTIGIVCLVVVAGSWACGVNRSPERWAHSDQPISEHKVQDVAASGGATKLLGEDCTTYGGPGCASGICLHTRPDRSSGYFCSVRCQSTADCPDNWNCVQTYPGDSSNFCAPPADWVAGVAVVH